MKIIWENGDIATFLDSDGKKQVAIRRDCGWKDGQWQVAIHGFLRVSDEFITENGSLMVEAKQ